jgi:hypothetical protein
MHEKYAFLVKLTKKKGNNFCIDMKGYAGYNIQHDKALFSQK